MNWEKLTAMLAGGILLGAIIANSSNFAALLKTGAATLGSVAATLEGKQ